LKAAFVCGGHHEHEHVRALHPPIDSLLLSKMSDEKIDGRKDWGKVRWSSLDSSQYQELIGAIAKQRPDARSGKLKNTGSAIDRRAIPNVREK
jgi:hypothetical protein